MTYTTGYDVTAAGVGVVSVPAFRGADPTEAGGSVAIDMNNDAPLTDFSDDEAYSLNSGMMMWSLGTNFDDDLGQAGTIKNLHVWHQYAWGIFSYETCGMTIDGFIDIGDQAAGARGYAACCGINSSDYRQKNLTILNARIEGEARGYTADTNTAGLTIMQNSILRNRSDFGMITLGCTNGMVPPRRVELRNVQFGCLSVLPADQQPVIVVTYEPWAISQVVKDELVFYDFNGVAGDDFQVYYPEQAPDFIVPQSAAATATEGAIVGSPVAGLTNAQTWATYGIAIAGAVLPNGTITRAGIVGAVLPLSSVSSNPPPTVATAASASPNPVTGTTTALSVLGADAAGEPSLNYTWTTTGSPPAPVLFSANGTNAAKATTATFTSAGSYAVQVTISDPSGLSVTSTVTVNVTSVFTALALSPTGATVIPGGTLQLIATATDQFGASMPAPASALSWSTSGGGTISGDGLFTAGPTTGGPFTVTAASGGITGTTEVLVLNATSTSGKGSCGFGSGGSALLLGLAAMGLANRRRRLRDHKPNC